MKVKLFIRFTFALIYFCSVLFSQTEFSGNWEGRINIANKNIAFQIEITCNNNLDGKLSIPEQSVYDLHLDNLKSDSLNISFNILSAPQTASFSGILIKADSVNGSITQSGLQGKFFLIKSKVDKELIKNSTKSNFVSKEVIFHNGNIKLTGTLTVPDTIGNFPAVVLLTGSGPQNRDENIYGFKIFKIIANHLTNNGFAVLRFDDRGIGGSSIGTTTATTADNAEDALSAIHYLKNIKYINNNKIGLLGHSEGGLAAVISGSASNDVAFIILMAGPSVPGGDLVIYQMKKLLKAKGTSQEIINKKINLEKELVSAIKNNEDITKYKSALVKAALSDIELLPAKNRETIKNDSAYAEQIAISQINSLTNPWIKFFFTYNPSEAIENINCPILILFGGKDMQVPVRLNKGPFEKALTNADNNNYKIVVFPNANHLFQYAKSGLPEEYNILEKHFVHGFFPTIIKWLNAEVKNTKS